MLELSKGPIRNFVFLRVLISYKKKKNRAKFNQYDVSDCCLLCGAGAETRVHFVAECPRLDVIRNGFREELRVILNHNNPEGLVDSYLSVSEQFVGTYIRLFQ